MSLSPTPRRDAVKRAADQIRMATRRAERAEVSPDCPPRPASTAPSDLGFVRRPMVRWLDPRQLVDTAARVMLAGIFGSYADKRELLALAPAEIYDRSSSDELWFDYVADLGDGWNPTYTVARLLAAGRLTVNGDDQNHETERGRILVMGGDEVYPVAKRTEYLNRLLGPYQAALPCTPEGDHPDLFAIPGSHDWYDGLINFMRIFCRKRWIGGWKTRQSRSYWAVKLPHRWWLWGIDIQFDSYVDEAQLKYFADIADRDVEHGDRVILCTAKPAWVSTSQGSPGLYSLRNLRYFERTIVEPSGGEVALYLASGLHHYSRYQEEGRDRQRITAGGGGAFLYPTHHLPDKVELAEEEHRFVYSKEATFPDAATSRRLRRGLLLLPFRNLPFVTLLASLHLLIALMLGLHLSGSHLGLGSGDLWQLLWRSPTAALMLLLILIGMGAMTALAHHTRGLRRFVIGLVHSLLQLSEVAVALVAASALSTAVNWSEPASFILFMVALAVFGGFGGAFGLAAYLWVAGTLGIQANEAYGPLGIEDFKHWLRLHIASDGTLTVFPIGIDRVCRDWRLIQDAPRDAPWFEPAGGEPTPCLIEPPIRLPPPPPRKARPTKF